jgi:S-ribosylhomocysteine lyase
VRNQKPADVFAVTKEVLAQILAYEGPVFGASAVECGNYRNLDLNAAKEECRAYLDVLEKTTNLDFTYPN